MSGELKRVYFNSIGSFLAFTGKLVGRLHSPWTHKYICYSHVLEARRFLAPGDIILTRTAGELSTAVIPGFYKHAAIYAGDDRIVHAVGTGVGEIWLADLLMKTDNVAIMRLRDLTAEKATGFVDFVRGFIGTAYDLRQDFTSPKSVSCSELAYHGINHVMGAGYLELRERMGYPAFTPQDFRQADRVVDLVLEILDPG